ncbi:hypothetical protein VTO73DRAFT_7887 [Trametes versicolor]
MVTRAGVAAIAQLSVSRQQGRRTGAVGACSPKYPRRRRGLRGHAGSMTGSSAQVRGRQYISHPRLIVWIREDCKYFALPPCASTMAFVAELGWQLRNAAGYFSAPKPTALLLGPLPKSLQDSGSLARTARYQMRATREPSKGLAFKHARPVAPTSC